MTKQGISEDEMHNLIQQIQHGAEQGSRDAQSVTNLAEMGFTIGGPNDASDFQQDAKLKRLFKFKRDLSCMFGKGKPN